VKNEFKKSEFCWKTASGKQDEPAGKNAAIIIKIVSKNTDNRHFTYNDIYQTN
jgi:hypothetical protein